MSNSPWGRTPPRPCENAVLGSPCRVPKWAWRFSLSRVLRGRRLPSRVPGSQGPALRSAASQSIVGRHRCAHRCLRGGSGRRERAEEVCTFSSECFRVPSRAERESQAIFRKWQEEGISSLGSVGRRKAGAMGKRGNQGWCILCLASLRVHLSFCVMNFSDIGQHAVIFSSCTHSGGRELGPAQRFCQASLTKRAGEGVEDVGGREGSRGSDGGRTGGVAEARQKRGAAGPTTRPWAGRAAGRMLTLPRM